MLDQNWFLEVEHIYQEDTRATNFLAGIGHSLPLGVHYVSSSDPTLFLYDALRLVLQKKKSCH
ncbi:hypothetical protein LINGRAHAP2_LOCUS26371 [Linum grandiflorum]